MTKPVVEDDERYLLLGDGVALEPVPGAGVITGFGVLEAQGDLS